MTAIAFPFGSATGALGDSLSARYSWHWIPLELGMGIKLLDELYVGGYFDFGVGWEGSDLATRAHCEAGSELTDDVSCSTRSVHAGIELRYGFTPADGANGWLGYGLGFTSASQSISDSGRYSEDTTAEGIELGRLSGGVDFRPKRGFGLGPFAALALGRYLHQRTEIRNRVVSSGAIDDGALHAWFSLGLRMVVFP